MSSKIDFATQTVIIDRVVDNTAFFGGSYSKQFTVEKTGTYLFLDCFSCTMHRAENSNNNLYVKIDDNNIIKYRYDGLSDDTDWGSNRRTLCGTQRVVELSEGTHTISTSGNLYRDDQGVGHMLVLIMIDC